MSEKAYNSENPKSISGDLEAPISPKEAEDSLNSDLVNIEGLDTKPDLVVGRVVHNSNGLFGYIFVRKSGGKYKAIGYTLEPPKNIPLKGYIPAGIYKFKRWDSPKLKKTLRLYSVPNFTNVLIHVGNSKDDTRGCILAGYKIVTAKKPRRIAVSRNMTNYLYDTYSSGRVAVGWI